MPLPPSSTAAPRVPPAESSRSPTPQPPPLGEEAPYLTAMEEQGASVQTTCRGLGAFPRCFLQAPQKWSERTPRKSGREETERDSSSGEGGGTTEGQYHLRDLPYLPLPSRCAAATCWTAPLSSNWTGKPRSSGLRAPLAAGLKAASWKPVGAAKEETRGEGAPVPPPRTAPPRPLAPQDTEPVRRFPGWVHQAAPAGRFIAGSVGQPEQGSAGGAFVEGQAPPPLGQVLVEPLGHHLQGQLRQPVTAQRGHPGERPPGAETARRNSGRSHAARPPLLPSRGRLGEAASLPERRSRAQPRHLPAASRLAFQGSKEAGHPADASGSPLRKRAGGG